MVARGAALQAADRHQAQSVTVDIRGVSHSFALRGSELPVLDSINLRVSGVRVVWPRTVLESFSANFRS